MRTQPGPVVDHLLQAPLAQRQELGEHPDVLLRQVDGQALDRLVHDAVDLAAQHLRLADGQLEALAAHHLDEDRELQLAAALHLPGVRAARLSSTRIETLPTSSASRRRAKLAGGELVAVAAGQRRGVDADRAPTATARRRG